MSDTDTYEGPDLAALLVLMMRNARDGTQTVQPFGSFKEQIDGARALSSEPQFQKALSAIAVLQGKSPEVIEQAHFAIRAMLLELEATNLWGSCKLVHPEFIRAISKL
jgi:hypothetical protein